MSSGFVRREHSLDDGGGAEKGIALRSPSREKSLRAGETFECLLVSKRCAMEKKKCSSVVYTAALDKQETVRAKGERVGVAHIPIIVR